MSRNNRPMCDASFADDAEIADLVAQFESCTWPYERWTHRAHLAVADYYLARFPFDEALDRIRTNIQHYNRTCGDADGYHETITVFFMQLVRQHLENHIGPISVAYTVNEMFHAYGMDYLLRYYSSERLWSPAARAAWLAPDLRPAPF